LECTKITSLKRKAFLGSMKPFSVSVSQDLWGNVSVELLELSNSPSVVSDTSMMPTFDLKKTPNPSSLPDPTVDMATHRWFGKDMTNFDHNSGENHC